MSLRARLVAAFAGLVAVPLVLAALILARTLPASAEAHGRERLTDARAVAESRLSEACQRMVSSAVTLARTAAKPDAAVRGAVSSGADVAELLGPSGEPVATAAQGAADLPAAAALANDCRGPGRVGPRLVAARVQLTDAGGRARGAAVTAVDLTSAAFLAGLTAQTPARAAVLEPGAAVPPSLRAAAGRAPAGLGGAVLTVRGDLVAYLPLEGGATLLLTARAPDTGDPLVLLGIAALLGLLLAVLAARQLASSVTRPLTALSEAATRVAAGDLQTRLPERPGTEAGELAAAFNRMTEALQRTITDLRDSRDELHKNVSRLGDALAGTHDLDHMLAVILDTAVTIVHAEAGALLLTTAGRDALHLAVGRGLDDRLPGGAHGARIAMRWRPPAGPKAAMPPGAAARVAATGEPLYGEVGPGGLELSPDEPRGRAVLAVPLRSSGRVTGVLCLYDPIDGAPFAERDLEGVLAFVEQATVAIDNVLMHQEAQRLSITDGLTGLWNYRYATLALGREVERALRFHRPLAVLMLDLDRFKDVNDRFGHPRGDAVLIEVAQRLRSVVREVDVLARYGGEELLLILPETDLAGAEQLAGRILHHIRSAPMGGPGEEPVRMTTSIGIAVLPADGETPRALLRAADGALYAAKAAGRDTARSAARSGQGADLH